MRSEFDNVLKPRAYKKNFLTALLYYYNNNNIIYYFASVGISIKTGYNGPTKINNNDNINNLLVTIDRRRGLYQII